jgi:hypothetical protein
MSERVYADSSSWYRRFVVRLDFHTPVPVLESEPEYFSRHIPVEIVRESFLAVEI